MIKLQNVPVYGIYLWGETKGFVRVPSASPVQDFRYAQTGSYRMSACYLKALSGTEPAESPQRGLLPMSVGLCP